MQGIAGLRKESRLIIYVSLEIHAEHVSEGQYDCIQDPIGSMS
jgi:hypothetical protein